MDRLLGQSSPILLGDLRIEYETLGFEEIAADWARKFVADKFGAATTHWAKLQSRIERGVGSPCPLLLVGVPATEVGKEKLE